MCILFNKERTSCLANLIGYRGIMSSAEQQEQRKKHSLHIFQTNHTW